MEAPIDIQPLPQRKRARLFLLLVAVFVIALPFLYMYATGYRFDIKKPTTFVSTGGMYIGVDQLGAEIYIEDELMRETRTFRKAFYAQGLEAGMHRVHVQKEGYHTWVKELPVAKHRVTVAEAFNLPLVPSVRVLSPWLTAAGEVVLSEHLKYGTTTQAVIATTTRVTSAFVANDEYALRRGLFEAAATTPPAPPRSVTPVQEETATTSKSFGGVRLYEEEGDVYAEWIGQFNQMPYYYCAEAYPSPEDVVAESDEEVAVDTFVMHPIQEVSVDSECDPTIRIDNRGQTVHDFQFFPGSADLVLMVLDDGVYAVEIDDRSWQNAQPFFLGDSLQMYVEGSTVYLYDGSLIYQVLANLEQ